MSETNLKSLHPDDALAQIPPPPNSEIHMPTSALPGSSILHYTCNSKYRIRLALENEKTIQSSLRRLSVDLHWCHRQRIQWTDEASLNPSTINQYHQQVLVSPILQIFNQLRADWVEESIQSTLDITDEGESIIQFHADDFPRWGPPVHTPIIIFSLHGALEGTKASVSPSPAFTRLLQRAWGADANSKVIMCDMESIIIIHPSSSPDDPCEVVYEHVAARDLSVIRILIAAYLYTALPQDVYIDIKPRPNVLDTIIPSGAQINPDIPLSSDEEVFQSHSHHSDFDYYTITHDRQRALQFFRWKEWVKDNCSPAIATSGDVIKGVTNGFARRNIELMPFYPVDELPPDTTDHLNSFKRPRSPDVEALSNALGSSESFELELTEDLTQDENSGLCKTFKCRVISVDEKATVNASPTLCVKFYDDRFHPMAAPAEEDLDTGVHWWWMGYIDAESRIKCEDMTYKRLDFVQGSLLPCYYGAHLFILPNKHELYGVLMEYIPAPTLDRGLAGTLSRDQQIQLIKSTRHAVRILQYADLSQHDWHSGQLLCNVRVDLPQDQQVHCVLIDFGSVTVSQEEQDAHMEDDFGGCLEALCEDNVGLDGELVWDAFGKREPWDTCISKLNIGEEGRWTENQDPFLSFLAL